MDNFGDYFVFFEGLVCVGFFLEVGIFYWVWVVIDFGYGFWSGGYDCF